MFSVKICKNVTSFIRYVLLICQLDLRESFVIRKCKANKRNKFILYAKVSMGKQSNAIFLTLLDIRDCLQNFALTLLRYPDHWKSLNYTKEISCNIFSFSSYPFYFVSNWIIKKKIATGWVDGNIAPTFPNPTL